MFSAIAFAVMFVPREHKTVGIFASASVPVASSPDPLQALAVWGALAVILAVAPVAFGK